MIEEVYDRDIDLIPYLTKSFDDQEVLLTKNPREGGCGTGFTRLVGLVDQHVVIINVSEKSSVYIKMGDECEDTIPLLMARLTEQLLEDNLYMIAQKSGKFINLYQIKK